MGTIERIEQYCFANHTEKDLTLANALEIAIAMETASRDAWELQEKVTNETHNVNKFTAKPAKAFPRFRRGKRSHDQADCCFCDRNCKQCNQKDHVQRMFKMK